MYCEFHGKHIRPDLKTGFYHRSSEGVFERIPKKNPILKKMWSPRSVDWCSPEHVLEESCRDWRSKTVFEYLYTCYFKL